METNKWDKNIKRLLDSRSIQPSEKAWEKLSAQISKPGRKPKRYYGYAIAAGIATILLLSALYFQTTNQTRQSPVSATGTNISQESEINRKEMGVVPREPSTGAEVAVEGEQENTVSGTTSERSISAANMVHDAVSDAAVNPSSGGGIEQDSPMISAEEALIQHKIEEVVAQVNAREKEKGELADAEVEMLLRAAQQEILTSRDTLTGQAVDAVALLSEVETELNGSFRDQIFEKLKEGYIKVRTAVADRNN